MLTLTIFLQMFEKGSHVKQGNVAETKYTLQCAFSAENHVQMACEFHDLNMDLGQLRVCLTIASNSYTHRYARISDYYHKIPIFNYAASSENLLFEYTKPKA